MPMTTTTTTTTSLPLPNQQDKPAALSHATNSHGGSSKKKSSKQQGADEEEDEVIRVYDGNTSLRKNVFRTIFVNRNCSYLGILLASLRAFHINDDPQNYYLSIPIAASRDV